MRLADPGRLELGPERDDQQDRQALARALTARSSSSQRGRVDPVRVLEDHQRRPPAGQPLQPPRSAPRRSAPLALRARAAARVAVAGGQRSSSARSGTSSRGSARPAAARPACRADLGRVARARIPAARSSWADDRVERAVLVVRRAEVPQCGVRLLPEPLLERATSRDLPTPGSPESSTTWPSPSSACAPAPRAAGRAPPRGRPAASGPRRGGLEPARDPARRRVPATRAPARRSPWPRPAPRSAHSNRSPSEPARARGDRRRCRARPTPAAGRRGSGSRRPRLLPGRALAEDRPPPPARWRCRRAAERARPAVEAAPPPRSGEPGAHRPLSVVLVRPRLAEVGQHAVADVLGDVPALRLETCCDAR